MASSSAAGVIAAPPSAAATMQYSFDAWGGSWSIAVWGGLVLSVAGVLLSGIRAIARARHAAPWATSVMARCLLFALFVAPCAYLTWEPMSRLALGDMEISGYGKTEAGVTLPELMHWLTTPKAHRQHSLFFVAYKTVCESAAAWYISSQLLTFVLTYAAWLWLECARVGIPRLSALAVLWIGFAGAICVSFAAFSVVLIWRQHAHRFQVTDSNAARSKTPALVTNTDTTVAPSLLLLACIFIAILSLPFLQTTISAFDAAIPRVFKLALLIGHFALLVPFGQSVASAPASIKPATTESANFATLQIVALLAFLAGISLMVHISNLASMVPLVLTAAPIGLVQSWVPHIVSAALSSPAQESISMDLAMVSLLVLVFVALDSRGWRRVAWPAVVLVSIASAGALAPVSVIFPCFLIDRYVTASAALTSERKQPRDHQQ